MYAYVCVYVCVCVCMCVCVFQMGCHTSSVTGYLTSVGAAKVHWLYNTVKLVLVGQTGAHNNKLVQLLPKEVLLKYTGPVSEDIICQRRLTLCVAHRNSWSFQAA